MLPVRDGPLGIDPLTDGPLQVRQRGIISGTAGGRARGTPLRGEQHCRSATAATRAWLQVVDGAAKSADGANLGRKSQ